jgi:hypothetical protein
MWSILDNETEPYGPENVCRWINGPYRTGTFHVVEATEKTLAADEAFEILKEMYDSACTNATSTPSKASFLRAFHFFDRMRLAKAQPARKGE